MPTRDWGRIVGIWQIVGGIAGAATFLEGVPAMGAGRDTQQTILLGVLPLCGLSALSGWALIRGHAPATARGWATALWDLQLAGFRAGEVAFRLALAPFVFLNIVPGQGVGLTAALHPHLLLYTRTPGTPSSWLTINLLALFALALLWRPRRTQRLDSKAAPDTPRAVSSRGHG